MLKSLMMTDYCNSISRIKYYVPRTTKNGVIRGTLYVIQ